MAGPLDLINRAPSSRATTPAAPKPAPKPKLTPVPSNPKPRLPAPTPKPKMATPSPAPVLPAPKPKAPPPAPTLPVPVPPKPTIPPPEKPPAPVTPAPKPVDPNRPLPNPSVEAVGQTEPIYLPSQADYLTGVQEPSAPPPAASPVTTPGGAEMPLPTQGANAPGLYTAGNAPQVAVQTPDAAAFMNPYLEGAMEPTLRRIREQGDANRNRIGATAATSGAFGDDRHRVLDQESYKDENQQVADTVAQMMSSGYGQAMGDAQRVADRNLQGSSINANLQDSALGREWQSNEAAAGRDLGWNQYLLGLDQREKDRALSAAGVGSNIDLAENGQLLQLMQEQMGMDNYTRGWEQLGKNADWEQWLQKTMWPITKLQAARGTGSAVPQSAQQSDTTFQQLIGGLIGGLF